MQQQQQQQRRRPPLPASPISMNNNNNNNFNRPMRQLSRNAPATVSSCSGCSQPIYNPTISNVLDRHWHPDCVRCFVCRCLLNEQCYSREGKLYCKDDFIKKYIHRCFSCQNLIQSHEFIRRVRTGRIYHADCFVCFKCKHVLQDNDIAALMPADGSTLNELECVCQSCLNPEKKLINQDEDETTDSDLSNTVNGKQSSIDQLNNEEQTVQNDDKPTPPPITTTATTTTSTGRPLGRPPKSRQNSSNNTTVKRTPPKAKATRQKQTTNERKGRPPATRSKSSTTATVQTRSSNRRSTKTSRYRKRTFSSGSDDDDDDETDEDEDEDEDDDDDDTDFTEEEQTQDDERERSRSPATKTKTTKNSQEKKTEAEPASTPSPPPPPPRTTSPPRIPESSSLLSGLSANPMPPNFMLPNFPTTQHVPLNHPFPPGFPLQPRLPVPPPPGILSSTDAHHKNPSENEQTDPSTTPAHTETTPTNATDSSANLNQKPSALSSLLEFESQGPSNNPYPFPFVTPGPGVPFSPQTAAGMTTFFRPQFNVPPVEINQESATKAKPKKGKKRAAVAAEQTDVVAQNILDEPLPPKKKPRKTNPRGKGKAKKGETDGENDLDEDNKPAKKPKKKKSKKDMKDSSTTDDNDESKVTNGTLNPNASQSLLAQVGFMNNPSASLLQSSSANNTSTAPNAQQQAQIAAMYNMTPNFAAYNAFPNAYNPAFPPGPYPPPYGFHPAFGGGPPPPGQPFPFRPPTMTSNAPPSTDDKSATPIVVPETRPTKSKSKAKTNATGEKKKPAAPRGSKKKAAAAASAPSTETTENEESTMVPSTETTGKAPGTSETTSTPPPTKRRVSGTESEDFDEQNDDQAQTSQAVNSKSGNESDGSIGNANQSTSTAPEKKGGRTTIKPQQLEILNKSFDSCSKPNKNQREQLAADTGLNIRVIQVWFQNKRSKERKGKVSKEKETALDDDEGVGEDSPIASPQPSQPPLAASQLESPSESTVPVTTTETSET